MFDNENITLEGIKNNIKIIIICILKIEMSIKVN